MSRRPSFSALSALLASGVFVLITVHSSALFECYGFSDDYWFLLNADQISARHGLISDGRIIPALTLSLFAQVNGICGLRFIRALSLAGICLLFILLQLVYHRKKDNAANLVLPFLYCLTPAFSVFAGWASLHAAAFGCAAAAGAGALADTGTKSRRPWLTRFASLSLVICSLACYQPSAGFFWVALLPDLFQEDQPLRHRLRAPAHYGLTFGAAIAVYLLLYRCSVWPFTLPPSTRGAVSLADIGIKLREFFLWPLPDALSFFALQHRPVLMIFGLSAIACELFLQRTASAALYRCSLGCAAALAAYSANFGAGVISLNFRSSAALYCVVLYLAARGAGRLLKYLAPQRKIASALLLLLIVAAAGKAHLNTAIHFVRPQVQEVSLLRAGLRDAAQECPKQFTVLRPNYESALGMLRYDEFGQPSTLPAWGAETLVKLLLREKGCTAVEVQALPAGRPQPSSADLGRILTAGRAESEKAWTFYSAFFAR